MNTKRLSMCGLIACVLTVWTLVFTACDSGTGTYTGPAYTHTHDWGGWMPVEGDNATQERVCADDPAHWQTRLTGTDRFTFSPIDNGNAYSVEQGALTEGEARIPAYYRPDEDGGYLPVTEIPNVGFNGSTYIGAFVYTNFTAVHISEGITSISEHAFYWSSLTAITIPTSVRSIGEFAFYRCTSLTDIIIPAGVTSIGDTAFEYSGLTSITVDESNPRYASEGGVLYNKAKTTLITAPPQISGSVTIPASVTTIGKITDYTNTPGAFSGCSGLTDITFAAGSRLKTIGFGAFIDCSGLTEITIPASVTSIGDIAFRGCGFTTVTFAAGSQLQTIDGFDHCTSLISITIPAGVTGIGGFDGCTSLTSINIPDSVLYIRIWAFERCPITTITIPASVTWIGFNAFSGWTSSQTINVLGYAYQAAADAAFDQYNPDWGSWRSNCDAQINYLGD